MYNGYKSHRDENFLIYQAIFHDFFRKGSERMTAYDNYDKALLEQEHASLLDAYNGYKTMGLALDMSRGKPEKSQLDLSQAMLGMLKTPEDCISSSGADLRNYGILDGIDEAKHMFADILGVPRENLIVCGNSSLNMMYDAVTRCMLYGAGPNSKPWSKEPVVKFLCPAPGYDRHFAICESMGIQMITVPMTKDGPNMDVVEALAASDDAIKGIWCVPKYSNPEGVTYSDETVRRFAQLQPAAKDFRIFWDNAYAIHDLYETGDELLNIQNEVSGTANEDMVFQFTSTSKVTFPGSGVACIASSLANINFFKSIMTVQTIGFDKLNMLRHAKFFEDIGGIRAHMKLHAAIIRPKFEAIHEVFDRELAPLGIARWTRPRGGYFISLNVMKGCAKRVWELMKDAGVVMTPAGATFPYGKDPKDANLRIAPSYPPLDEIKLASEILAVCVKLATVERYLAK